ncbi:MAG: thiol reductant ABC exporter subunit CydD [Acetobacter papayae]
MNTAANTHEGRGQIATLARTARGWLALSVACGAVSAACLVGQFVVLAHVVDDTVFHARTLWAERGLLGLFIACLFGCVSARFASDMAGTEAGLQVVASMRTTLLQHLTKAGPVASLRLPAGQILTVMDDGVEALEPFFARYVPSAAMMVVLPLLILAVVCGVDGWSFVILACTGPLVPVCMVFVGYSAQKAMDRQWGHLSTLAGSFLDALRGLKTLRLFGRTAGSLERIGELADAHRRATLSVMKIAFLTSASLEFFASLSIALVAVVFGSRLLAGTVEFRSAFLVLLLAPEYFAPLRNFSASYHARQNAMAALEQIARVQALPELAQGMECPTNHEPGGQIATLVCAHVSAAYDTTDIVLRDVSCTFSHGQLSVLSGASGTGKSTLLSVILGLLPPMAGNMRALDANGQSVPRGSIRMAYVPQRPQLVYGSVADNLRIGQADASPEALRAAAHMADALEFIEAMPQGFATLVGERGCRLSKGQARRLALARALLCQPDVLVLDEPTADLDPLSARRIARAIQQCVPGRIVIAATHKAELVACASQVLDIAQGQVTQRTMPERRHVMSSCAQEACPV